MSDKTSIEWTESSWNPLRGCSRVSQGCVHCYAEGVAARFSGPGEPYDGLAEMVTRPDGSKEARWTGEVRLIEKHLADPIRWKRPRRIFVNSMSDIFHEKVPDVWIDCIFGVMALAPQHTFQLLTKRPERMLDYMTAHTADRDVGHACGRVASIVETMRQNAGDRSAVGPLPHLQPGARWWPLANVWLGTSVENQETADERIPILLETPAAIRWISAEPLLGPIDLRGLATTLMLDWVVVGGESGRNARPMHPQWARDLRDQCVASGCAFFYKQNGEYVSVSEVAGPGDHFRFPDGATVRRTGKKLAGAANRAEEIRRRYQQLLSRVAPPVGGAEKPHG